MTFRNGRNRHFEARKQPIDIGLSLQLLEPHQTIEAAFDAKTAQNSAFAPGKLWGSEAY